MRAALGAKHLRPFATAFCRFHVGLGRPGKQFEVLFGDGDADAEGGALKFLAIRAMTDSDSLGIGNRCVGDEAAMAAAIDFHDSNLFMRRYRTLLYF